MGGVLRHQPPRSLKQNRDPAQPYAKCSKADQWAPGWEGTSHKGQEETFGGDKYVHFLDHGDGLMTIHTSKHK